MAQSGDVGNALRKLARDPKLLRSLLTAHTDDEKRKLATAAGIGPFTKEEVEQEITKIIGAHKQPQGPSSKVEAGDEPPTHVAAVASAAAAAVTPP